MYLIVGIVGKWTHAIYIKIVKAIDKINQIILHSKLILKIKVLFLHNKSDSYLTRKSMFTNTSFCSMADKVFIRTFTRSHAVFTKKSFGAN